MRHRRSAWQRGLGLALVVGFLLTLPGVARAENPGVFPLEAKPFGKSYPQWTARWWEWVVSIPSAVNPILAPTGTNCAIGQRGPVWFLAGTPGTVATRDCTIPSEKAILIPLVNILFDFPCPDPTFVPPAGQSLEDFLTQGAQGIIDLVDVTEIELDGTSLGSHRVTSRLFRFVGAEDLKTTFDPCITGSSQLGVSDGYWVLLKPLSPGAHTLHVRGGINGVFIAEVTYNLTVLRGKKDESPDGD